MRTITVKQNLWVQDINHLSHKTWRCTIFLILTMHFITNFFSLSKFIIKYETWLLFKETVSLKNHPYFVITHLLLLLFGSIISANAKILIPRCTVFVPYCLRGVQYLYRTDSAVYSIFTVLTTQCTVFVPYWLRGVQYLYTVLTPRCSVFVPYWLHGEKYLYHTDSAVFSICTVLTPRCTVFAPYWLRGVQYLYRTDLILHCFAITIGS